MPTDGQHLYIELQRLRAKAYGVYLRSRRPVQRFRWCLNIRVRSDDPVNTVLDGKDLHQGILLRAHEFDSNKIDILLPSNLGGTLFLLDLTERKALAKTLLAFHDCSARGLDLFLYLSENKSSRKEHDGHGTLHLALADYEMELVYIVAHALLRLDSLADANDTLDKFVDVIAMEADDLMIRAVSHSMGSTNETGGDQAVRFADLIRWLGGRAPKPKFETVPMG